jgi:hypothetical protein
VRRALLAVAALALLAVPAASANGDPASDVLLTQQVFVGPEVPLSQSDQDALTKTVAEANKRGYPIRVALIAFTGDLGTAVSLWRHPQEYSKFLWNEVAFVYNKRLLVVMPDGFGVYNGKQPVAKEQRALANLATGTTPANLAQSATQAVRALAASGGVDVPAYTTKSTATRDRLIIAAAGLAILLIIVVPGRKRLRGRGGERSPSAEPHSSPHRSPGSSDPGTDAQ